MDFGSDKKYIVPFGSGLFCGFLCKRRIWLYELGKKDEAASGKPLSFTVKKRLL